MSIGALEHFAPPAIDRAVRVAIYSRFFETSHGLLSSGGRLGIQTIALDRAVEDPSSRVGQFLVHDVFSRIELA